MLLSDVFLISILPVPLLMFSEKVRTMLVLIVTFVALSVGEEELKVGVFPSITIALLAAKEFAAPGVGKVKKASFPDASLILVPAVNEFIAT